MQSSANAALIRALGNDLLHIGRFDANLVGALGTSAATIAIQNLHKAAGELVHLFAGQGPPVENSRFAIGQVEGALHAVALLGVVSSSELDNYLERLQAINNQLKGDN